MDQLHRLQRCPSVIATPSGQIYKSSALTYGQTKSKVLISKEFNMPTPLDRALHSKVPSRYLYPHDIIRAVDPG